MPGGVASAGVGEETPLRFLLTNTSAGGRIRHAPSRRHGRRRNPSRPPEGGRYLLESRARQTHVRRLAPTDTHVTTAPRGVIVRRPW
jgi:hypothetical protein